MVYAFECNPDCVKMCKETLENEKNDKVIFIENAITETNGIVSFFPFDTTIYDNPGASSMLKIDFTKRDPIDPDYMRGEVQTEIKVIGTRLDTFLENNTIQNIDMLCIDLQGYELNAIKSLGDKLNNVKYIITECSIDNTYIGGANFTELNNYLNKYNFFYKCSNTYGNQFPVLHKKGFSEFDALFVKNE